MPCRYEEGMRLLGLQAHECVVFEDSPTGACTIMSHDARYARSCASRACWPTPPYMALPDAHRCRCWRVRWSSHCRHHHYPHCKLIHVPSACHFPQPAAAQVLSSVRLFPSVNVAVFRFLLLRTQIFVLLARPSPYRTTRGCAFHPCSRSVSCAGCSLQRSQLENLLTCCRTATTCLFIVEVRGETGQKVYSKIHSLRRALFIHTETAEAGSSLPPSLPASAVIQQIAAESRLRQLCQFPVLRGKNSERMDGKRFARVMVWWS